MTNDEKYQPIIQTVTTMPKIAEVPDKMIIEYKSKYYIASGGSWIELQLTAPGYCYYSGALTTTTSGTFSLTRQKDTLGTTIASNEVEFKEKGDYIISLVYQSLTNTTVGSMVAGKITFLVNSIAKKTIKFVADDDATYGVAQGSTSFICSLINNDKISVVGESGNGHELSINIELIVEKK